MSASQNPPITNVAERRGVVTALAILEAIQLNALTPESCSEWIAFTFDLTVDKVSQRGVGAISVDEPPSDARTERFQQIAAAARREVITVLRGLLAHPQDDAFVSKALYAQHVQRRAHGSKVEWAANPERGSSLSSLILLLFIVDILGYRDTYDSRLSICDECGRISFVERRTIRYGCVEHPVG